MAVVTTIKALKAAFAECDNTVNIGMERVITTSVDIVSSAVFQAFLANDDIASGYGLAAEFLHAEIFWLGIAYVLGGSTRLFMSHIG